MTLVIDIFRPPSVNRLWRNRTGRTKPYLDLRYAKWKRACDNLCLANGWNKTPIKGPYELTITLDRKQMRSNADLGNREKAVSDWLQRAGIIEDDKLAQRIEMRFGHAPAGCRVELRAVAA